MPNLRYNLASRAWIRCAKQTAQHDENLIHVPRRRPFFVCWAPRNGAAVAVDVWVVDFRAEVNGWCGKGEVVWKGYIEFEVSRLVGRVFGAAECDDPFFGSESCSCAEKSSPFWLTRANWVWRFFSRALIENGSRYEE